VQRTIMISYWKGAGVPHLPLIHKKTGMSEALRKYFSVEGLPKNTANLPARKTALEAIIKAIKATKTDLPPSAHPKLNVTLKAMKAGVIAEVADYNDFFVSKPNWKSIKANPEAYELYRAHCVKEFSIENFNFLTAVDEKKPSQHHFSGAHRPRHRRPAVGQSSRGNPGGFDGEPRDPRRLQACL
jgi:hypothetical protein